MHRTLSVSAFLATATLLAGAAALRAPGDFARDLSGVPADPTAAEARLKALAVPITAAAEAAARACSGAVSEIRFVGDAEPPYYAARAFGQGREHHVRVDAASGEVTSREELPPYVLPGDPVKGELVTTASGLMYYELREGSGRQPAGPKSWVQVHYTGWLVDGTKFDSTVDLRRPKELQVNRFVSGMAEGVLSMKVGGKRKLLIPYRLAFGEPGNPPSIPRKAMLVFDVELLSVNKD